MRRFWTGGLEKELEQEQEQEQEQVQEQEQEQEQVVYVCVSGGGVQGGMFLVAVCEGVFMGSLFVVVVVVKGGSL